MLEQQVTGKKRLGLAFLLGMLAAFGPLTIDMYLPSFPDITRSLNTSASLVQLSLTACLLGLAAGQLVIGPLSDSRGRKRPLLLFIALYVLASFACAFAPNIYFFILGRFLQGFTAAAGIVISRAVVRDLFSGRELTKFFSLLMLINGLFPIMAPVFGAAVLLVPGATWDWVFIVLGILGILIITAVAIKLKETLPEEKRRPSSIGETLRTFKGLLKDRLFMGLALTQGLMTGGIFAYVSGTPFVYQNIYEVSPQTFSILFGVNGLGIILGTHLVGRYAGIVPERVFLRVGLIIAVIASGFLFMMTLIGGPLISIVIPIFFFVSMIGMVGTTSFALAMETKGEQAGSASALLGLLPFGIGAATAPLVGIAGEETAVPMGLIIFVMSAAAFLSFTFLARGGRGEEQQG
ncbi:multidrug effflux MFS transporter [Alkalicoccobacillus murimartini]|uniref:Bcr/CflA family efflux transporter n=1 Tax=Alkalicoccobacillus murimartini TaxID=171685 RepID=A0ABT9YHH5_9BACI|nr:multidrug effflux MFS transporter [Alkalicoccobacillus murimartini]MDQ0207310.1 DHA1 family bicyclomycin/chloramphenicol resistance-like MFS transporter [Alkalicoccobacillus murimartini]